MAIHAATAFRWRPTHLTGGESDVVRLRQHGDVHLALLANGFECGFSTCWPPASRLILDLFEEAWGSAPGDDDARMVAAVETARECFVAESPGLLAADAYVPEDEPAAVLLAVAVRGATAHVAWIGGDLAVQVRDGAVVAATTPHTFREHIRREHPDEPVPEHVRDIHLRSVGSGDHQPPATASFALEPGDTVLLLGPPYHSGSDAAASAARAAVVASPAAIAGALADAIYAAGPAYAAVAVLRFDG